MSYLNKPQTSLQYNRANPNNRNPSPNFIKPTTQTSLFFIKDADSTIRSFSVFSLIVIGACIWKGDLGSVHWLLPAFPAFLILMLPNPSICIPKNIFSRSFQEYTTMLWVSIAIFLSGVYLPSSILALILRIKISLLLLINQWIYSVFKSWKFMPKHTKTLYFLVFSLWIVVTALAIQVYYLKLEVNEIQKTVSIMQSQIKDIYEKLEELFTNDKLFNEKLQNFEIMLNNFQVTITNSLDSIYVQLDSNHKYTLSIETKLLLIHGERAWYRLGCVPAGTKIQIDREGNTEFVERVIQGSTIYSPFYDRELKVKLTRAGPETGLMYQFTLSDGSVANVTSGHAMLIESQDTNGEFSAQSNTAARDVKVGDRMNTVKNGKQRVIDIKTFDVENVIVYNFMIEVPSDLPDSEDVLSRVVVVNDIEMLDLYAQEQLAPIWQRVAAYLISFIL